MPPKLNHITSLREQAQLHSVPNTEQTPLEEQNVPRRHFLNENNRNSTWREDTNVREVGASTEHRRELESTQSDEPHNNNNETSHNVTNSNLFSNLSKIERTLESDSNKYNHNKNNISSSGSSNKTLGHLLRESSNKTHPLFSSTLTPTMTTAKEKVLVSHESSTLPTRPIKVVTSSSPEPSSLSEQVNKQKEHTQVRSRSKRHAIHATLVPKLTSSEETLISNEVATNNNTSTEQSNTLRVNNIKRANTRLANNNEYIHSISNNNVHSNTNDGNNNNTTNNRVSQVSNALLTAATIKKHDEEHNKVLEVMETSNQPAHHRRHYTRNHRFHSRSETPEHNPNKHEFHVLPNAETPQTKLLGKENRMVNPVLLLAPDKESNDISWANNSLADEIKPLVHNTLDSKQVHSPSSLPSLVPISHLHNKEEKMISNSEQGRVQEHRKHPFGQVDSNSNDRNNNNNNNNVNVNSNNAYNDTNKANEHQSFLIATDEALHSNYNLNKQHVTQDIPQPVLAAFSTTTTSSSSTPHVNKLLTLAKSEQALEEHDQHSNSSVASSYSQPSQSSHTSKPSWMKTAQSPHHSVNFEAKSNPFAPLSSLPSSSSLPLATTPTTRGHKIMNKRRRRQILPRQIHASLLPQQLSSSTHLPLPLPSPSSSSSTSTNTSLVESPTSSLESSITTAYNNNTPFPFAPSTTETIFSSNTAARAVRANHLRTKSGGVAATTTTTTSTTNTSNVHRNHSEQNLSSRSNSSSSPMYSQQSTSLPQ